MNKQETAINYTLVHGTFGARSDWLNESSEDKPDGFRALLKNHVSSKVTFTIPKPWGGKGLFSKILDLTNKARLDGAEQLKSSLAKLSKQDSNFIIAHSHGGNVAMYALQDAQARAKVDGVICLATPFLYPRQRPLSILTLLLSLAIIVIGFFQFSWRFDLLDSSMSTWYLIGLLFIVSVMIPGALVFVIIHQRFRSNISLDEHLDRLSFSDPKIPILLIRASGDEASGLLRAGQFFNWFAGVVMRIGGRHIYVLLCLSILALAWSAYRGFGWLPEDAFSILSTALIGIAALMVVMLMVLTLSRVFVGLDAWRWVGEIETMTEDGPPGVSSELKVLRPQAQKYGLSHTGIFTQAETIKVINTWCEKQIAQTS